MACSCKRGKGQSFQVQLPGGLKVTKTSEAAALAFSAKHPGSKVVKPATT